MSILSWEMGLTPFLTLTNFVGGVLLLKRVPVPFWSNVWESLTENAHVLVLAVVVLGVGAGVMIENQCEGFMLTLKSIGLVY